MMQTMRNSAKIVFFLVLVAFAGFMVLQGLTSIFSDPTRGGKAAPPGVIGSVDDVNIPISAFENAYRPRLRALLDKEEEPTEEEMAKIRDDVWNNLVSLTTLELAARRHGIVITDAEVAAYMRMSPPQDLLQLPDFQTDSTFDIGKYQTWLQQVAASNQPELVRFLDGFEKQMRQQILINRLQSFITGTVQVTPLELKDSFRETNEKVKVDYIFIPGTEFSDEVGDISDEDILARYEADKDRYKRPEQAVVSYVQFTVSPSDEDYELARDRVDSLYGELQAGADFSAMAREVSEDQGSGSKGGDLGWFGKGKMVEPFWEAVIKLKNIGDISQPVKTQFGWHIIKLTGRRDSQEQGLTENPETEYRASHILLKVDPSQATIAAVEEKANNFIQDAVVYGFKESAEVFDLPVSETKPFAEGGFIPGLGSVPALSTFAFSAKVEDISEPIPARSSVMVCQLKERIPEGYTPLEEVSERIERALTNERQTEKAFGHATELAMKISAGEPFSEVAAEDGRQVQETDYFARSQFIPKVGSDPDFIGNAFSLSDSKPLSGAIKARSGAYILKFVDRQEPDSTQFAAQQDSLMQATLDKERREIWSRWVSSLKSEAQIQDYRSFYYGG
jgi:parvulin-like peptidyl-prolyl isomerase